MTPRLAVPRTLCGVHLLHGGYFLCQACNHSKQPQIHQSICHFEVHHLQDLKERWPHFSFSVPPCEEACTSYPVHVDLFFFRQMLFRNNCLEGKKNLKRRNVAVATAVLLHRNITISNIAKELLLEYSFSFQCHYFWVIFQTRVQLKGRITFYLIGCAAYNWVKQNLLKEKRNKNGLNPLFTYCFKSSFVLSQLLLTENAVLCQKVD